MQLQFHKFFILYGSHCKWVGKDDIYLLQIVPSLIINLQTIYNMASCDFTVQLRICILVSKYEYLFDC